MASMNDDTKSRRISAQVDEPVDASKDNLRRSVEDNTHTTKSLQTYESIAGEGLARSTAGTEGEQSPRKPFAPLFVVVEDSTTGEHHHPYIHYIFSDDDQDHLTNAILHNLSPTTTTHDQEHSVEMQHNSTDDRVIIVDLDATGRNVVAAQSLSKGWQVTDTRISAAPTFDNGSATDNSGLMLQIDGVEQQTPKLDASLESLFSKNFAHTDDELLSYLNALSAKFQEQQATLQKLLDEKEP